MTTENIIKGYPELFQPMWLENCLTVEWPLCHGVVRSYVMAVRVWGWYILLIQSFFVLFKREDEGILVQARYQAFACTKAD